MNPKDCNEPSPTEPSVRDWSEMPMPKKSPTKLPITKFLGKYPPLMAKARAEQERQRYGKLAVLANWGKDQPPAMITSGRDWEDFADWGPIGVLRQAAEEGDHEGCKRLLSYILMGLDVRLPTGVLMPFRWKRGRPNETEPIYEAWVAKGRPIPSWRVCEELAKAFYPDEAAKARSDTNVRKTLRDRVRKTIRRHQLITAATKSTPISSRD